MKGDFSRVRFDRDNNYTSVLTQQGRVQLDSDANEQRAIDEYLRATGLTDIIGRTGTPIQNAGMAISVTPAADSILIGPGRYYVDGLLCEADTTIDYRAQPYLIGALTPIGSLLAELRLGRTAGLQVWLEAWQRLVMPIDDPCIKDVALGEADTTVRRQTVWRVVVERAPVQTTDRRTCCQIMHDLPLPILPGQMTADTDDASGQGHCLPSPQAAYRGLENQLYRVEVHHGGAAAQATFKWSRENGSVLTRIVAVSGSVVTVDSLGPDANLGFAPLQWVEISDDSYEFGPVPNQPGVLCQIQTVDHEHRQITLTTPAPAVNVLTGHAKLRRWDQDDATATANGVPMAPGGWHALENGIRVQFSAELAFRPGDHWLIPARTATGTLEWPPCGSNGADLQPAQYTRIHRAPLACLHLGANRQITVDDCRDLFSPLTALQRPIIPPALHVTAASWPNDDIITIDQLAFQGLTVSLDGTAGAVDADSFIVTLEIPTGAPQRAQFAAVGGGGSGILRYAFILDGTVTPNGNDLVWSAGIFALGQLYGGLQALLENLANSGVFIRARVALKGRTIRGAGALSGRLLDGQVFGQPATRADGLTPRVALSFPSGDSVRASDFESWFFVAPVTRFDTMTVAPATVAFVVVPGTRLVKLVDATSGQPNPNAPAAIPVLTITLGFNALQATTVALSVAGGTAGIVTVPASVTIARGSSAPAAPVQIQVRNPGPVTQSFTITASLVLASGQSIFRTATLTVTGVTDPGGIVINPGPIGPIFQPGTIVAQTGSPLNIVTKTG
jgi:Family of unknown function (DUF6519)